MEWVKRGRVAWVFGDHFVPDNIVGGDNVLESDPDKLRKACMKDYDPDFPNQVRQGDFLVGGRNYGYGRSHASVSIALGAVGISGIIAESFARGFLKGHIYSGYPVLVCKDIANRVQRWDELEVNFKTGEIQNLTRGEKIQGEPLSPVLVEVMEAGGHFSYLQKKLSV